jgi:long-chain acyl-CoA synthetase
MELSLSHILFDRAAREPSRVSVLTPEGDITYGQVASEAAALSHLLGERALAGSRISILLPNIPRFGTVLHGILGASGTAVMTNPMNSLREVEEQFHDAQVHAAFTTRALARLLPEGTRALLVDDLPAGIRELANGEERWLPLDPSRTTPVSTRGGGAEAVIIFTAAESGRARGAVLSHRNLVANLRSTLEMLRLREDDRVLAALPNIHAFGLTVSLNAAMAAGAAIVPVERFHPARTLELIGATRATVLMGVPAMFMGFLSVAEKNPVGEHALRVTLCGGATLDAGVQARWEEVLGVPLRQGYGLTEASPVCLFNDPSRPNRPGTLGKPIPHVDVSIQDGAGNVLPDGEVGEICVRGENVFAGYLGENEDDPPYFRGPWLRTGDLGSRDADGYFHFRGVLKAMFTRSGFNVYPREVERAVAGDARVASASVTAQPDPAKENEIILEVVPVAGATLTEDDVREICRARLATYKQPGRILIREGQRGGDPVT